MKRSMPAWLKVILWSVGIAIALVGLYVAFVIVTFSGGIDDVFDRPGPYETDRQVLKARADTASELRGKQDELAAGLFDPSWQVPPGSDREVNNCSIGQHTWKRDDPFDLSCDIAIQRVAVGDMAMFEEDLESFHQRLVADGWKAQYGDERKTISGRLSEYWKITRDDSGASRSDLRDRPEAAYEKRFSVPGSSNRGAVTLEITLGSYPHSKGNLFSRYEVTPVTPPYPEVAPDQYALLTSLETNYFEK